MECSIEGCSGAVRARGWCAKHYRRWRINGDPLIGAANPPTIFPGDHFGRLTVISEHAERPHQQRAYLCECECGTRKIIVGGHLKTGQTQSCGCQGRENRIAANTRHGHAVREAKSPAYEAWVNMRGRCLNPEHKSYDLYGGRGITVCADWLGDGGFDRFLSVVGERPHAGLSLDRIDNDGNYEPGNVRWADKSTQRRNSRRDDRWVDGKRTPTTGVRLDR